MRRATLTRAVMALTLVTALAPAAQAEPTENYVWRTDGISKTLAGKPFADRVLYRVPGSFHDAPRVPAEAAQAAARGKALYGPGTPLYVGEDAICTTTVAGYNDKGEKIAITAGHCGKVGDPVVSADTPQTGRSGTITHVNAALDYAVITLGPNAEVTRTYNGVTINRMGGAPLKPGQMVCKHGVASGSTCAMTISEWDTRNVSQVCAMQGDSGAPLMEGDRLIGLINGGTMRPPLDIACHTPLQGPVHAPTAAARMDAVLADMPTGLRLP